MSRSGLMAVMAALFLLAAADLRAVTLSQGAATGFTGPEFDWLLNKDLLGEPQSGEPDALALVGRLMRENDPRAGRALQNYLKRFPRDPAAFDLAGTQMLRESKWNEAALALNQSLLLHPDAPWTRAKLGAALAMRGEREAARAQLERALGQDASNPLALRWLQRLAADEGDIAGAIRFAERSLAAFGLPETRINRAHLDLADLYIAAGRWKDVLTLLSPTLRVARIDAPDPLAAAVLGRTAQAATELGDAGTARAALARAAARLPAGAMDNPPWAVIEARTLRLEGKPSQAVAALDRLAATAPNGARALVIERARALSEAGRAAEALRALLSALSDTAPGDDLRLTEEFAAIATQARWPEGAIDALVAATQKLPGRAALDIAVASAESAAGRADAAARRAARALAAPDAAAADRVAALRLLGAISYARGERDAATRRLRDALEIAPDDEMLWLTLAAYTHDQGGHSHAGTGMADGHDALRAILVEATQHIPDSATLWGELGIVDFTAGDAASAADMFGRALALSPARPEINILAALAIVDSGGDVARARALAGFAVKVSPDNPAALDALGWAMAAAGETEAALGKFDAALKAEPGDGTTLRHRAAALHALGRDADAADAALAALAGEIAAHDRAAARRILVMARPAQKLSVDLRALSPQGAGAVLGAATFEQTGEGLRVTVRAEGLPPGMNAAHIHLIPTCAPGSDGAPGAAAGGHYDNDAHGHDAPAGDLPPLGADAAGRMDATVLAPRLALDDIRGRALMIHHGAGGGGLKIACAVIG